MKVLNKLSNSKHGVDFVQSKGGVLYSASRDKSLCITKQDPDLMAGLYKEGINVPPPNGIGMDLALDLPFVSPTVKTLEIKTKDLLEYLLFLKPSMSKEATRYYLCSICFFENYMVSTDGTVLKQIDLRKAGYDFSITNAKYPIGSMLPSLAVLCLIDLLKESKSETTVINFHEDHMVFTAGIFTLTSKLVDGIYPDFKKVIPNTDTMESFDFYIDDFKKALKQITPIAKAFAGTKLRRVELEASTLVYGTGENYETSICIQTRFPVVAAFDLKRLVHLHDGTAFVKDAVSPLVVQGGYKLSVILPLRL